MLNAGFALLAMVLAATPVVQATPSAGDAHEIPPVVWELVEISGASDRPVTIAEPERYPMSRVARTTSSSRDTWFFGPNRPLP